MIKLFNSFQITCLFAVGPFIMGWLWGGPFPYSIACFWLSAIIYLCLFGVHVAGVFSLMDDVK